MTKKDYELIANVLFENRPIEDSNNYAEEMKSFNLQVQAFAQALSNDNSAFDWEKFSEACYKGKHIRKSISGKA